MRIADAHVHGYDDKNVEKVRKLGYDKVYLLHPDPLYLKTAMKKYPQFFLGFGWVHAAGNIRKDLKLIDACKDVGCTGLKMSGAYTRYDDDALMPIYERAAKHNLVIVFHTGYLAWEGYETWTHNHYKVNYAAKGDNYHPITLDRIARNYPDLKMVMYHLGHPWVNEGGFLLCRHKNLYADLAISPNYTEDPDEFLKILGGKSRAEYGLFKLMFATDSETLSYEGCKNALEDKLRLFDAIGVSKSIKERIFYRNAIDVAGLSASMKRSVAAERNAADLALFVKGKPLGESGFTNYAPSVFGEPVKYDTRFAVSYSASGLEFLVFCEDKDPKKAVVSSGGVAKDLWQDDCFEIFLSPGSDKAYTHVVVNPEGCAGIESKMGFAEPLERLEHKMEKNGWAVKVKIPFSRIGKSAKPGDRWTFNIVRSKKTSPTEDSMWNETPLGFHRPECFGFLDFK